MRLLGTLESERHATRLADYLLARKMPAHVEESDRGGWQVWIEHDDHFDAARETFVAFERSPDDATYADATAEAKRIRREQQQAAERRRKNFVDVRTRYSGLITRPMPVAITLVVVTVLVGFLTGAGMFDTPTGERTEQALLFAPTPEWLMSEEAFVAAYDAGEIPSGWGNMFGAIGSGEVWRLITPVFIHYGILHLVFNLSWVIAYGQKIEAVRGWPTFVTVALAGAAVGCTAEAAWGVVSPWNAFDYTRFGGLSGVNFAFFGYAYVMHKRKPSAGVRLDPTTIALSVTWFLLCFTGLLPIANAAHTGGLLVGALIGLADSRRRHLPPG